MTENEVVITLPRRRAFKNVFQLKITLQEIDPVIWRRILIPESYTFYDLHVAIQNAMGWTDSHLHMFEIPCQRRKDRKSVRIFCPFDEPDMIGDPFLVTTEIPVREYFKRRDDRADYEYDFGDGWIHEVLLEDIKPRIPREKYPQALDGELACPPEDCGGESGYYECLRVYKERDDSEGLLTWLGNWRPDRFEPKAVVFESPRKRFEECLED
jgi:hypothetical protein